MASGRHQTIYRQMSFSRPVGYSYSESGNRDDTPSTAKRVATGGVTGVVAGLASFTSAALTVRVCQLFKCSGTVTGLSAIAAGTGTAAVVGAMAPEHASPAAAAVACATTTTVVARAFAQ